MKYSASFGFTLALTLSLSACQPNNAANIDPLASARALPSTSANTPPTQSASTETENQGITLSIKGDPALLKFSIKQAQKVCLNELAFIETGFTLPSAPSSATLAILQSLGVQVDGNTLLFQFQIDNIQALVDGASITLPDLPTGLIKTVTNLKNKDGNTLGSVAYDVTVEPGAKNVELVFKPATDALSGETCVALLPELQGGSIQSTAGGLLASLPSPSPSSQPSNTPPPTETPSKSELASIKLNVDSRFLNKEGQEKQLTYILFDEAGKELPQDAAQIQWSSHRPRDIIIDSQGKLKAITGLGFSLVTVNIVGTDIKDSVLFDVTDPSFFTNFTPQPQPTATPVPTPTPTPVPTPTPIPDPPAKINGEFLVNTTTDEQQLQAKVAMDSTGNFTVVWRYLDVENNISNIFSQRYDQNGAPLAGEVQVAVSVNEQYRPSIAMNKNGNYVVALETDDTDGSNENIYFQRYNNTGGVEGGVTLVNTSTANAQSRPSVANNSTGNFVVVWDSSNQDGSDDGVYLQRYNNAGTVVGGETLVNTTTANSQERPDVAMDEAGNFVVVWQSSSQDGSDNGVYLQRYNNAGATVGTETLVNTVTTGNQDEPKVDMDDAGNFVITWISNGQDGDGDGIYAQRYDNTGTKQGSEFLVTATTAGDQENPEIALDQDGDFIITWQSADANNNGVYAQKFDKSGTKIGTEFLVNTTTANAQDTPSVAMTDEGASVFAWQSDEQDGSKYGVYAQRYTQ